MFVGGASNGRVHPPECDRSFFCAAHLHRSALTSRAQGRGFRHESLVSDVCGILGSVQSDGDPVIVKKDSEAKYKSKAASKPEHVAELHGMLIAWRKDVDTQLPTVNPSYRSAPEKNN